MFSSSESILRKSAEYKTISRFVVAFVSLFCLTVGGVAHAQVIQTYYIPMPEDDAVLTTMQTLDPDGGSDPAWPVTTQISIAVTEDGTLVYWDHYEDGYEADIAHPVQTSTEIWGDGDASNGIPPDFTTDQLNAGDVIFIQEAIPQTPLTDYYNGGDKVAVTDPISLTRGSFASGTGAYLAGAAHVGAVEYETWGTAFIAPVGVDMSDATDDQMFEYTALYVQARTDGTTLVLNGVAVGPTLDEGEGYTIENVNLGDLLTSSNDIQVYMITGDIGTTWELRWYTLMPTAAWHNEYYSPVGTGDDSSECTSVWLHNPNDATLTIYFEYADGSQCSVDVPANDTRESTDGTCTRTQASANYLDRFSATNYNNSDGSLDWTANAWMEINDDGSPRNGYVYITRGELAMRGSGSWDVERVIRRTADLSGATDAELSFDIRTAGDLSNADYIMIRVSGDGGASWRTLETIINDVSGSRSYPLLATELAANTIIEFRTYNYGSDGGGSSYYEFYYIDDVQIAVTGITTTTAAPPVPEGSGVHFWTEGEALPFLPISTTDCNGGAIYDWGFSLIPADQLTPQLLVGGAPGCASADCGGGQNRSPVWVTPLNDTTIYVDYDAVGYNCNPNNLAPVSYTLGALEAVKIEDTGDNDMTAALIYTCDETPLAAAWGQDPARSYSNDQQALDMGTAILPLEKLFTPVMVSVFSAYAEDGRVIVEWQTASESGVRGFHLYKKDPATGLFVRLNRALLPSLFSAPQGGTYRFADLTSSAGETQTYKLVALEKNRKRARFGPYTIEITGQQASAEVATSTTAKAVTKMNAQTSYLASPVESSDRKQSRVDGLNRAQALLRAKKANKHGRTLKLAVREEGLHYLSAQAIAEKMDSSLKTVQKWISKTKLQLTNQGEAVAYLAAKAGAGIYFYGQVPDSPYSDTNVYWLSKGKGLAMKNQNGKAPRTPAAEDQVFSAAYHGEENQYALTALFDDPDADFWLWEFVLAGNTTYGVRSFTFPAYHRSPEGSARVAVLLQGGVDTKHIARIHLNGQLIGETTWSGLSATSLQMEIQADLLVDGENTLLISGLLGEGIDFSSFYIDSFDVQYPKYYTAEEDHLAFARGDYKKLTVAGFSGSDILLFDISTPHKPKYITKTAIEEQASGGLYQVSFKPQKSASEFLAVVPDGVISDFEVWADNASDLANKKNQADYLIIAPSSLVEAARQLAAYRQTQGYQTMIVDLEDVYDEANDGNASPYAIRDFLAHAHGKWRTAPRYVVLIGDGTYDYKDYLGQEDSLMPVMMSATPQGLFASDNRLADFDDDGIPELALGRLPVASAEELQNLVAKIEAYENGTGAWKQKVLLAADIPDEGGNFPFDSDALGDLVPGEYTLSKVYASRFDSSAEARSALLSAFSAGATLFNYAGHAGLQQLGSNGMMRVADLSSLSNQDQYPVVSALTCLLGRFSIPGVDSLGEQLLLATDRGAAAVWAPSGLSRNDQAMLMGKGFMQTIFDQETTLGDAVLAALNYAEQQDVMPYMRNIYILLGDPAMVMP